MEPLSHLLVEVDFPSPANSQYYSMFGDDGQHLDSSESQSTVNSPYDMSYMQELNLSSVYPSPDRDAEDEESQTGKSTKPAAKRKRENRYKNAPPAVLSRRRAQNRASQRAYRERKDQRIKDLETMLNDAKQRNEALGEAYTQLHAEYLTLKASQLKEQHLEAHQQQAHQTAYGGSGGELGYDAGMSFTGTGSDRLNLDMFVFPDSYPT